MNNDQWTKIRGLGRRRRWTADEATFVLGAWEDSALSASAFAEEHGFDPQRLYWWRRRIPKGTSPRPAPVTFAEIRVEEGLTHRRPEDSHFEITLLGGRSVRVPQTFDAEALQRLLVVIGFGVRSC